MTRIALLAAGLLATLALAAQAVAMAPAKLTGTVGPGFTISLKKAGKPVKKLKAGTYKITVSDKSNIHDFHLTGPGVNKMITTIAFKGTKTVTVKLKKGRYTFRCDPHPNMVGHFTVK